MLKRVALLLCGVDVGAQAIECFQRANEAAGGHADYTARIKVLRQKTGTQQKVAKVGQAFSSGAGWPVVQGGTHTHTCLCTLALCLAGRVDTHLGGSFADCLPQRQHCPGAYC